jgi:hypothetical protein
VFQMKCLKYWPDTELDIGPYVIKLDTVDEYDHYVLRYMVVQHQVLPTFVVLSSSPQQNYILRVVKIRLKITQKVCCTSNQHLQCNSLLNNVMGTNCAPLLTVLFLSPNGALGSYGNSQLSTFVSFYLCYFHYYSKYIYTMYDLLLLNRKRRRG